MIAPEDLAGAYADVIDNGDASRYASLFSDTDPFRSQVADNRAATKQEFDQTGATTGTLTFATTAGSQEPISLATLDSTLKHAEAKESTPKEVLEGLRALRAQMVLGLERRRPSQIPASER